MGLGSFLFGSTPKAYSSPYTKEYENKARGFTYNRMGENPGQNVSMGQATRPYDWSGYGKADATTQEVAEGYRKPSTFTAQYKSNYAAKPHEAFKFSYGKLPSTYGSQAYELGASDVRREGQGQLEKLRETIGTRRPGLLMRAGQESNRNVADNLSRMNAQIRLEEMNKNLEYGRAEQDAQAAENMRSAQFNDYMNQFGAGEGYREYGSLADLEGRNASERLSNLEGLKSTGQLFGNLNQARIQQEQGITADERAYMDQALQYLMALYGQGSQQSQYNAGLKAQRQAGALGGLGSIAGAAMKAYTG